MKKKKITEEQMSLFRKEVRDCIETHVVGGYSGYLDLWRRHSKHTGDMESDYVVMGSQGWNGYVFWRQAPFYGMYERCKFNETMTLGEFMCIVNKLWIKVAVKMLIEDLYEDTEGLAY
jgi:hypothetical protein